MADKSLFKRLQYAKEILVQMMSVQSMPPSLTLSNQNKAEEANDELNNVDEQQNYASQKPGSTLTNMIAQASCR